MARALRLARRGRFTVAPNPKVGAVVVDAAGVIAGEGWHRRAGEPHAEPLALDRAGARAAGGTLFVNLEPCAHHGRTPPCCEAIVRAGIARVVASHLDPDPRTAGRGVAHLRAAGIEVEIGAGAAAAIRLNAPFLVSRLHGRPLVTLKWGASLDGRIATAGGDSRWVTGEQARAAGLALRDGHDAILVGSGTLLADDPRLDRRSGRNREPIARVVLDRRLRTPPGARTLGLPGPVLVYTEVPRGEASRALERRGAEVIVLDRVDPAGVLRDLAGRGLQSVLIEGGGTILGAFRDSGLWDRVTAFVAPRLIGGDGAPAAIAGAGAGELALAAYLDEVKVRRRGADLEISGWREGCLPALSSSVEG